MEQERKHVDDLGDLAKRIFRERLYHHSCDGLIREAQAERIAYRETCAAMGVKPIETHSAAVA